MGTNQKGPTKKLHDLDVDKYLAECVQIFPEGLQEEFVRLPADLAYWNARFAEALRGFLTGKINLDRTEARCRIEERERLGAAGGKVTESMVESAVEAAPEMEKAREALMEAEVEKVRLYGVLDAIRAKRDMLISLGAQHRAEMAGDPSIRERDRAARAQGGE